MMPIKIVIADDDSGMRLVMRKIISKVSDYQLAGEAENGRALLELVETQQPQVVLMDVEMPEMSGVECARIIQDTNPRIVLIFATAHEEYMGDAFSVYAFDYLLKPFKVERALRTLELVRQRLTAPQPQPMPAVERPSAPPARLMLKHREGVSFVDMNSILLVQREERSTVLYMTGDAKYVTSEPLGDLEERLPSSMFFRSHKSYIVNINHIDSVTPYGRWTYVITLNGTSHDALITHEKFEELQKMFS